MSPKYDTKGKLAPIKADAIEALNIIHHELIDSKHGHPIYCELRGAYNEKEGEENSLAYSLATEIDAIRRELLKILDLSEKSLESHFLYGQRLEFDLFRMFLMSLYFFCEMAKEIHETIHQQDLVQQQKAGELFTTRYSNFSLIMAWANFFKHSGQYVFAYQPNVYFITDTSFKHECAPNTLYINDNFVSEAYKARDATKTRTNLFKESESICVELPNMGRLTTSFCRDVKKFYHALLSDKSKGQLSNKIIKLPLSPSHKPSAQIIH